MTGLADRIQLRGIRAVGHHGVLPEERSTGQEFVVDVDLLLPLAAAAATDRVAATVHYGLLAEQIVGAITGEPVDLIETLAERIAAIVLGHPAVEETSVTVHKPGAPLTVPFTDVAVRIERSRPRRIEPVVIALGANLGDREATLDHAVEALRRLRRFQVDAVSASLSTVAVTPEGPDAARPRYANRVLLGHTSLPPRALLDDLHGIERAWGRTRAERWGDRTLDLDLITHGATRVQGEDLTLPHPRAHQRVFVLRPWLDLDPGAEIPGLGPVRDLLDALSRKR